MVLIFLIKAFASRLKGSLTKSVTSFISVLFFIFSSCSFLSSIFFSFFKSPSFLSSSLNPLLNILPNGEYSNFACSTVLGFKPKSSPVNNSYLSKLLEESADILAASLSKSYCDSFCLIFLFKILI